MSTKSKEATFHHTLEQKLLFFNGVVPIFQVLKAKGWGQKDWSTMCMIRLMDVRVAQPKEMHKWEEIFVWNLQNLTDF